MVTGEWKTNVNGIPVIGKRFGDDNKTWEVVDVVLINTEDNGPELAPVIECVHAKENPKDVGDTFIYTTLFEDMQKFTSTLYDGVSSLHFCGEDCERHKE